LVAQSLRSYESKDFMHTWFPQIAIDEHGRKAELWDGDRQVQREGGLAFTLRSTSHQDGGGRLVRRRQKDAGPDRPDVFGKDRLGRLVCGKIDIPRVARPLGIIECREEP